MKKSTLPPISLLLALIPALTACGPAKETAATVTAPAKATPNLANGKAVFTRVCAACHQANGQGVPGVFPPLAGTSALDGDPARLIRIVLHGLQGPIEVKGVTYNSVMPPQGSMLKNHEIADVLSYVRSSWGHHAPPISPDDVAALRASEKRTTMWTWAELTEATK